MADLVVVDLGGPHFLAGLGIERDQHRVGGGEQHLVAPQPDAAIGRMQRRHVLGERTLVTPQQIAGLGVEREQLVAGRGHEHHAVVDDRRRLMALDLAGGEAPDRLQPAHIGGRDLPERAVAPAVIGAAEMQPVAVLRLLQPLGGDRRVFLQDLRHRSRHRRCRGRRDGLLRGSPGHAGRGQKGGHAHALHEKLGHDVSSSLFSRARSGFFFDWLPVVVSSAVRCPSRQHQVGTMPTRLVNGFATASLPSTILSGKAGSGAGGGTVNDGGRLARVVVREMTGAFEDLLLRRPDIHFAAGVRANR